MFQIKCGATTAPGMLMVKCLVVLLCFGEDGLLLKEDGLLKMVKCLVVLLSFVDSAAILRLLFCFVLSCQLVLVVCFTLYCCLVVSVSVSLGGVVFGVCGWFLTNS